MTSDSYAFHKRFVSNAVSHGLLGDNETVLVALSGGADSTVLLHNTVTAAETLGLRVYAAHLNHHLRGDESDRDEKHCTALCESMNVPLFIGHADIIGEMCANGGGVEEAARRVRYAFLQEHAEKIGADRILTAHNANDNAETVIMNLVNGAGTRGLRGIPEKRGIISRPLLIFRRDEIESYASDNDLCYVTDSTNSDIKYTRNYIRHVVIPDMEKINPSAVDAINRLTQTLREDPLAQTLIDEYSGSGRLTKKHIDAMTEAVRSGKKGRLSLPGRTDFVYSEGLYSFESSNEERDEAVLESQKLSVGMNTLSDGTIICIGTSEPISDADFVFYTGQRFSDGELEVRTRRPGDTVRLGGMTKSIKKTFIEKKVPQSERDRVPVICRGGNPVFVPYMGTDDSVRQKNGEERFYLSIYTRKAKTDQ